MAEGKIEASETVQQARDSTCEKEEHTDDSTELSLRFWWHVNKGGFPVPEDTWERMWLYVAKVHPKGQEVVDSIRGKTLNKVSLVLSQLNKRHMPCTHVFAFPGDIPHST